MAQCIVGIDFGTSTSLVHAKRYLAGKAIGDDHTVSAVTYGNGAGDSKAATVVRRNADGTYTCGRYGEEALEGSTVYRAFKMDLESTDPQKQELAKELTRRFFKYLFERYEHQKSDIGELNDEVHTIISYPAKWKPETVEFMESAASEAGFERVSSMDEPSAALYAVLCRKVEEISRKGLIAPGASGYMLLLDMGAGTTDLAICRYEVEKTGAPVITADSIRTRVIATWPNDQSSLTFGGREFDRILEDYLIDYLRSCGFNDQIAERAIRGIPGIKAWKEDTVSQLLSRNQTVNTCSQISTILSLAADPKPSFPAFGRREFEHMLGNKLDEFRELVCGCLTNAAEQEPELAENGIDLVVLTGGHSSWYFTSELLDGTMPGLDHPTLEKVRREKHRVLRLSNPQETVALGMVYSRLPFRINGSAAASMEEFICGYFPQSSAVRTEKIPLIRQYLCVPLDVKIFRAYDTTILGSCKNGTAFTDRGIYTRLLGFPMEFCSWEALANGMLSVSSSSVYVYDTRSGKKTLAGSIYNSPEEKLLAFYRKLRALARVHSGLPEQETISVPEDHPYEKILKRTLANCNPATLTRISAKYDFTKMSERLHIPSGECMYLVHDAAASNWGHPFDGGTILTDKGIHTQEGTKAPQFVSWQEFCTGTLEIQGESFFLLLPDGTRKLAGRFHSGMELSPLLYLKLQNAFRNSAYVPSGEQLHMVEQFWKAFDWSGFTNVLSPAYVPAVREDAEKYVGKIFLANKILIEGEHSKDWRWIALGEKGIYVCYNISLLLTNKWIRNSMTWETFRSAQFGKKKNAQLPLPVSGFPDKLLPNWEDSFYINDMKIPYGSVEGAMLHVFLTELWKYMQNPASYQSPRRPNQLRPDYAAVLESWASEKANGKTLQLYDEDMYKQCKAYIPEGCKVFLFYGSGCITDRGFTSKEQNVDFKIFVENPLWAFRVGFDTYFYAGTHRLMIFSCLDSGQAQALLDSLNDLQNQLQSQQ